MQSWGRKLHSCFCHSSKLVHSLEFRRQFMVLPSLSAFQVNKRDPYCICHFLTGPKNISAPLSLARPCCRTRSSATSDSSVQRIFPHLHNGPGSLKIHPNDIHLWWVQPPFLSGTDLDTDALLLECAAALTQDEAIECLSSKDISIQRLRLIARAFLRSVLVQYVSDSSGVVAPSQLSLNRSDHGKPALVHDHQLGTSHHVRFNLTHTDGLVGVAVALGREVGIDAELQHRRTRGNIMRVARRHFSAAEVEQLENIQDPEARVLLFMRLWTLKEAFVKAVGRGIAAPPGLKGFSFSLQHDGDSESPEIRFCSIARETSEWGFALLAPTERHIAAVSWERNDGEGDVNLRTFVVGANASTASIVAVGNS